MQGSCEEARGMQSQGVCKQLWKCFVVFTVLVPCVGRNTKKQKQGSSMLDHNNDAVSYDCCNATQGVVVEARHDLRA